MEDSCTCEAPSHYILFSECLWAASPIICGDCKCPVPLYKFPKTYDGTEYFDLLGWQKAYRACDRQFYEGIGERHGYKMMHDPNSLLSKEALQYCSIEALPSIKGCSGRASFYSHAALRFLHKIAGHRPGKLFASLTGRNTPCRHRFSETCRAVPGIYNHRR